MSELDDRIREGLERLARPADASGALEGVARRKRRYRTVRRVEMAALALAVVAGSAAGIWGLSRGFDLGGDTRPGIPATEPTVGPTTPTPTRAAPIETEARCPLPWLPEEREDLPPGYEPRGEETQGDFIGDGRSAGARVVEDETRPLRCRFSLVVDHPSGRSFYALVPSVEWLPYAPGILMGVEVDGEPGLELVLEFGGPGHPHRTGIIYTFDQGALTAMRIRDSIGGSAFVPLHDEFAGGVDCAGEPGTIVVTEGGLADGGADDRHFDITRTRYRARGSLFEEIGREEHTVEVGAERSRWPELADDPFRSCPR